MRARLTPENKPRGKLLQTPCVCAAARRAARAITQLYDLVLAPTGIKATQFIVLREIGDAGEIAQWQLAEGYAVATETLSRRLGIGRKKGMLQVRRGTKRGEQVYSLTPYGRECLENARPHWEGAQQRIAQALGNGDLEGIVACLDRLTAAAQIAEEIRLPNKRRSVERRVA